MDFRRANEEFKRLKAQFEAGQLAEAEFKAELRKRMVQDEQGAWWMIGYETERWYRHDGTSWVQADPPIQLPPEATPVESPQPERPERASTERVPPVPAAVGKAAAAPPRRPVIPIAIGAVILLLAAGYFLLQARSPEAEPAATPTQGGDSLIVDKLGITSTPSPAPTLPPTPIRTPVVTASPTPEPSSTPKAELHVSISSSKAFLYKGPDSRYESIKLYPQGEDFIVVARDPGALWLLVRARDGNEGWLYLQWVDADFDLVIVPTATYIPPLPAPTRKQQQVQPTKCIFC